MAQQIRVLATKSDHLNSSPETDIVEEENYFKLCSDL